MAETKIINQHSVEIGKNSRGFVYTIKAYGNDAESIEDTLIRLRWVAESVISRQSV